ncbi:MAG TPA: hypothetical protein VN088_15935, partial [Nocardioides sp.]|nr:hypothetical protein [Nocardioides sp.]
VFVNYFAHGVEEFTRSGAVVGMLKVAPIGAQTTIQTWALGLQGDTLLVATQQWSNAGEVAVQRFDAHDNYLDQVRGPSRANVGDDYAVGVAPYPGGGYVVLGVPTNGDPSADVHAGGLVRLAADGEVLGRLAEKSLSPDGAAAFGLAVDCAGRIIGDNVVTGRVFRLQTSNTVCRWLPAATTGPVTSSTRSSMVVRATVNPSAQVTKVRVQYGATTAYGHLTPWITLPSDNVALVRSITLAGLTHAHRYHYRVQATNASGTVVGRDATGATR